MAGGADERHVAGCDPLVRGADVRLLGAARLVREREPAARAATA